MLQAVIYNYFIVTMILTKELVIATDNCTEFKSPYSYVGDSCEDIYNKNAKSHKWPGYYTIVYKVYCGMTYTGSSCENIFKKYPEIHRSNPKEKSGYYRLNNNQWTYCDMTEIATGAADFISMCSVVEVGESRIQSSSFYNYQSFLPGKTCESIYNSSKDSHNSPRPGYYWITNRVYCGMNYTELSCMNIYTKFPETQNKPGYYRIKEKNDYQWTYCNMTGTAANGDFISTCAGVGGGWRRIVNIDISAGDDCPGEWRKATQSGVSFCRVASDSSLETCSSANFSTNGITYQRVCGRARGYQKGRTLGFYLGRQNASIDEYYISGLSITYSNNPRQHIWSFVSGYSERSRSYGNCPCASVALPTILPSFVANNYYCESAALYAPYYNIYFFNDTLWDGVGCIGGTCCDDTTQPWFYRQLNQTIQDEIEARICSYGYFRHRSPLIDQLELYIQ